MVSGVHQQLLIHLFPIPHVQDSTPFKHKEKKSTLIFLTWAKAYNPNKQPAENMFQAVNLLITLTNTAQPTSLDNSSTALPVYDLLQGRWLTLQRKGFSLSLSNPRHALNLNCQAGSWDLLHTKIFISIQVTWNVCIQHLRKTKSCLLNLCTQGTDICTASSNIQ